MKRSSRSLAFVSLFLVLSSVPSRAEQLTSSLRQSNSSSGNDDVVIYDLPPVDLHADDDGHVQPWWVSLFECVVLLSITKAGYDYLMSVAQVMRQRNEHLFDEFTKMTVIVPHSKSIGSGSERDARSGSTEASDESAALLSMKGWNYYEKWQPYQSIASDLSDQSGDWVNEQDD